MRGRSALLSAAAALVVGLGVLLAGLAASQGGLEALGALGLGVALLLALYALAVRRRVHGAELTPDPQGEYRHLLVPLKWGLIGDEVLLAALRLAEEQKAKVTVLHVVQVPRSQPLDLRCPEDDEAERHLEEARQASADVGVEVELVSRHARDRGHAICDEAKLLGCDLIVMGSSARWRRQSRILSPAADYVVRHADCQVMVVSYPEGAFDDVELAPV